MKTQQNQKIELKGIEYLVDGVGRKKAVVIDLTEWGDVWEDFFDVIVSQTRKDEETISWDELKAE